ncbi:MAG: NUDIX hydrolase [Xanthobacteraceae bacterium]|nr:MAG: NUDIX hydrolase [Xanthobacteraceae bacterium]
MTLVDFSREQKHPNITPRDAATLILIDRTARPWKVLFGRRHPHSVFMPNALVFPGGRVDAGDRRVALADGFNPLVERKLLIGPGRITPSRARAFGVAAIREAYEETGLCIGRFNGASTTHHATFADAGLLPDLSRLNLVARAITPPKVVRRFDARFFAIDADAITHRIADVIGPDTELVELVWLPIEEALAGKLPPITRQVLHDLNDRIEDGMRPDAPVPFYRFRGARFGRDWL